MSGQILLGSILILSTLALSEAATVPAGSQALYDYLLNQISDFDTTVSAEWNGSKHPVAFSAGLSTANGNRGKALLATNAYAGVSLELDRLQSLGVKGVVVNVSFPLLFESFHQWNEGNLTAGTTTYQAFLNFYTQLANDVHSRGLKLIVESGVLFPGVFSTGSGLDVGTYYPLLNNSQYYFGRAQNIVKIAQNLNPDYLSIGSEPDSEQQLTGKPTGGPVTPAIYANFVNYVLGQLTTAGVSGIPVGAGVGSWDAKSTEYVTMFSTSTSLSYIDIHVYPINFTYLTRLLSLSDIARANGKGVAMSEAWTLKATDAELTGGVSPGTDPAIFARDVYSYWAPVDKNFLQAMVKFSHLKQLSFFSAFWEKYFFAYLDYDQVQTIVPAPTNDQLITLASQAAAQAIVNNQVSETGTYYGSLIASSSASQPPVSLSSTLADVRVYPNPWRSDRHAGRSITFDRLPSQSTVKLFDLSGRWVQTLHPSSDSVTWNRQNSDGKTVASGLYLYMVTDSHGETKRGKLTLIQ